MEERGRQLLASSGVGDLISGLTAIASDVLELGFPVSQDRPFASFAHGCVGKSEPSLDKKVGTETQKRQA
jgi:hypothetical protein